ncbi:uncharacterized protein LOC127446447 [Myxocyprinus asiaticus]|uniref:uncharacterized protein LOC127446447 n=1 Tax=Myxocyprinus asiaticus TaxID=70543 RepID=UPI002221AB62|nr:uncharacterized protein LOC127446447 [Myxocyprinus asiaticus]
MHLSSELSAKANLLASHQQQLGRLTTLMEKLVKSVQSLHRPAPESVSPVPQASQVPVIMPHSTVTANPHFAFPEKFDDTPTKCKGFLMQCSMFLAQQPSLYLTDDNTLKLLFRQGLNTDVQSELACRDEDRTLDQFIDLAIRIDNLIRSRRPNRFTSPLSQTNQPSDNAEPMQVGRTHLSTEERERRIRNHLCLYCGQVEHLRADCPTRLPQTHNRRWQR